MHKNSLSIATITWVRDEHEEKLMRQSLQQLATLQVPVFITDGGSGTHFLDFLKSFPHFTLLEAKVKGVWAQAKNSLLAAHQAGSKFILYTEPDKLSFFSEGLPHMLAQMPEDKQWGVILASRSEAGFASFPPFQQMTETTINNCCREIIGKPVDYTYGPFLMSREIVPYLHLVQKDIGWGFRPYIFGMAHRLGYSVEAFVSQFYCPPEQRKDNPTERIYRIRQLNQNIEGLLLSTTVSLNEQ